MNNLGGQRVFASEWDKNARKAYATNFKNSKNLFNENNEPTNFFAGDITLINPKIYLIIMYFVQVLHVSLFPK
ncbi:hypothetical protein [Mycoplasmopsis fermentans]|uniref:DNA (cytosine-5-)-methyltransferase n=2 Tax=Mycoplasmopsis fermentans TaxID=2115 RepID=C4XDW4_MYCFP|nr:hypothetical protein [Mycoplasmopsis fermentans]VEU67125.1 Uncharacterised protein [Mesomycoplasma conjunctivae]ADV34645.1 Hypothetical Protein MfeM64YM_0647 [Mycoplasmopsis fermentans M64]RMX35328.1 hypothetical protein MFI2_0505 [Mycoplasmopsis fermentans MF-I2]RMX35469.1 hypothetical protein MFI1_0523 [Mycoplasmopsis fermentans MF-I1]VEU63885.1 Uncharacterised protein [Mycoplasmopsis fermentans]